MVKFCPKRAGISRVVTEIIMLVMAVVLALMIFSPLSDYIFGTATNLPKVSNAEFSIVSVSMDGQHAQIYLMNKGSDMSVSKESFFVFIDGQKCDVVSVDKTLWKKGDVVTVKVRSTADPSASHQIKVFLKGFDIPAYYIYKG